MMENMNYKNIDPAIIEIVHRALEEDLGDGDVTSEYTVPEDLALEGRFVARAAGVIAGLEIAGLVFRLLDERVTFETKVTDGARVRNLQTLAVVRGPGRALLSGERTALNLLQRMSGIATTANRYVEAVKGTQAVILDTRKTVPGLRILDKMAVRLGGAQNHRTGLYDMVLIKNNHIAAVGGDIAEAVKRVRAGDARRRPIEVEVRDFDELRQALPLNVERIMLDNMTPEQMRQAVALVGGRTPLEASGGITLKNAAEVARTGVDFISVGALTHSVKALDISLWIEQVEP
jgi:nicotinate-nucleotide pyrophosphorylase (carboxylating)